MQWNCPECAFRAWGRTSGTVEQLIAGHVVDHHRETLRDVDAGVAWSCPHCASTGYKTRFQAAIEGFRGHVRDQHTDRYDILDRDVESAVDGEGGILVDAPPASDEAATAVAYAHSTASTSIVVTSRPRAHVAHLDGYPDVIPDKLSLVTTRPVVTADFETSTLSLETVTVEHLESDSLGALGTAISRCLAAHEDGSVSLHLDIFAEMLDNFPQQTVFQFVHTLCERVGRDGSVAYFLLDTTTRSDRTADLFRRLFDLELTATEDGLVDTDSRAAPSSQ